MTHHQILANAKLLRDEDYKYMAIMKEAEVEAEKQGIVPTPSIHDLQTCPYNSGHKVGATRFAKHVLECRKQNPKLHDKVVVCEYNASHHIPVEAAGYHLLTCKEYKKYKKTFEQLEFIDGNKAPQGPEHCEDKWE